MCWKSEGRGRGDKNNLTISTVLMQDATLTPTITDMSGSLYLSLTLTLIFPAQITFLSVAQSQAVSG